VLEIGDDTDFAEEALGTERSGKFRPEHLERDLTLVAQVAGEVDGSHAALSQLTLELIPVSQRGTESVRMKLLQ